MFGKYFKKSKFFIFMNPNLSSSSLVASEKKLKSVCA